MTGTWFENRQLVTGANVTLGGAHKRVLGSRG